MAEKWVCQDCETSNIGWFATTRRMETMCDVCESDMVPCRCYVDAPERQANPNGALLQLCFRCEEIFKGDPMSGAAPNGQKIASGVCSSCRVDATGLSVWQTHADAPPQPPEPTCAACRFFVALAEKSTGDLYGTCHRYPPQVSEPGGDGACWPYMLGNRSDAWCGEFQAKPLPHPEATR